MDQRAAWYTVNWSLNPSCGVLNGFNTGAPWAEFPVCAYAPLLFELPRVMPGRWM